MEKSKVEKEQFRSWLLNNKKGIYSILIKVYSTKLLELKVTFFAEWLSSELDVPLEKINLSSLYSSINRQKKTIQKHEKKAAKIEKNFNTDLPNTLSWD